MSKKSIIIGVLALIVAIIAGVALYQAYPPSSSSNGNQADVTLSKNFTSPTYGFSFNYPETYTLKEQTSTNAYAIVLNRTSDLPLPANSDGPTAITVNVYQNASGTSLGEWLTANGTQSNFTLPNTASRATTVAGDVPAVGYLWEGLYFGLSIAFEHNQHVIIFTGTYDNPSDQIVKDFEGVAASIKVQ